jgi:hypothetical protein
VIAKPSLPITEADCRRLCPPGCSVA